MLDISLKETRAYREIEQKGREKGRQEGERSLVLRQLTRRLGELSRVDRARIESLPLATLEDLGEALLDFDGTADLQTWLEAFAADVE